jgi:hypothetical protein
MQTVARVFNQLSAKNRHGCSEVVETGPVSERELANPVLASPPDPVVPQQRTTEQTRVRCTSRDCDHSGGHPRGRVT